MCKAFSGDLTLANKEQAESFLVDARFFAQDDLRGLPVFPEILKEQFWEDVQAEYPVTRYLGLEQIRF